MPRPKFYRDPVHGQIRFDRVEEALAPSLAVADSQPERALSWLIRRLVDSREFQRLRHIRQNGLVNVVFHGAEHSRFGHSLGCAYLSREMYYRIVRNMDEAVDGQRLLATTTAALLHDVGHGPFSHVCEEILQSYGIPFDHEVMTFRYLTEEGSEVARLLAMIDGSFPQEVGLYINKKARAKLVRAQKRKDHWCYKIVSSQIDADRLDYLVRDAYYAGLEGHGFDLQRLLDMLLHLDHTRIAVYRRAIEPVEGYLLALDQMYRTVYYHHTARAASAMLSAVLRRAFELYKQGDATVLPDGGSGRAHPLRALVDHGQQVDLSEYARLCEFHVFALIEDWQHSRDRVLADLAQRLLRRHLSKAIDVDPHKYNTLQRLQKRAEELVLVRLPHVDRRTVGYYVSVDEPERTSYKLYDWRNERADESIWIVDGPAAAAGATASGATPTTGARPIEKEPSSIITALQTKKYFHRLIVPPEIRDELARELDEA
jgi:HD superfamily phosphohydrolase